MGCSSQCIRDTSLVEGGKEKPLFKRSQAPVQPSQLQMQFLKLREWKGICSGTWCPRFLTPLYRILHFFSIHCVLVCHKIIKPFWLHEKPTQLDLCWAGVEGSLSMKVSNVPICVQELALLFHPLCAWWHKIIKTFWLHEKPNPFVPLPPFAQDAHYKSS